jgi:N-acetylglutamate synthase-like GNAT family acetyltransferase
MKLKLRTSNINDIDKIYDLQLKCFGENEAWYKQIIYQYIDTGLVIEDFENNIIGVLLQGNMTPCNKKYDFLNNDSYKEDIFEPITEYGNCFLLNNNQFQEMYGILMICIDEKYRGKKLAQKLISTFFSQNKEKNICLLTRQSNTNAYNLYLKMGFNHIANIKNKYFNPTEDAIFMVKHI